MTPEFQLQFLNKIQRLFSEGSFTASYKFALLISIADITVEFGVDNNERLLIKNRTIGEKFIELYWQHASPFKSKVLVQNNSRQAKIITLIDNFKNRTNINTFISARSSNEFSNLLKEVTRVVREKPIFYIQNFEGETDAFMFEIIPDAIILKEGISFCFRRFQPLIQKLSRIQWLDHIKRNKQNSDVLGDSGELENFLFDTSRQSLNLVRNELMKLTDRCFYCKNTSRNFDVDHFIPHSLYHRDLMQNFVLSCPTCNRSKSDILAAKIHLENWVMYIEKFSSNLSEIGDDAGIVSDQTSMKAIIDWGYKNAINCGAKGWIKQGNFEIIDESYLNSIR